MLFGILAQKRDHFVIFNLREIAIKLVHGIKLGRCLEAYHFIGKRPDPFKAVRRSDRYSAKGESSNLCAQRWLGTT